MRRHVEAQRTYFNACSPHQRIDILIDNQDFGAPRIVQDDELIRREWRGRPLSVVRWGMRRRDRERRERLKCECCQRQQGRGPTCVPRSGRGMTHAMFAAVAGRERVQRSLGVAQPRGEADRAEVRGDRVSGFVW
jgi:hypothetical protein